MASLLYRYQARHELSKALRIASQGLAMAPRSFRLLEARAVISLQVDLETG
jgi:hypothetical protein